MSFIQSSAVSSVKTVNREAPDSDKNILVDLDHFPKVREAIARCFSRNNMPSTTEVRGLGEALTDLAERIIEVADAAGDVTTGQMNTLINALTTDFDNKLNGKLDNNAKAKDSSKLDGKTRPELIQQARSGMAETRALNNKLDKTALTTSTNANSNTVIFSSKAVKSLLSLKASHAHHHDTRYATKSHHHDDSYAAKSHAHDSRYAAKSHHHNDRYAAKSHHHDTRYAAKSHHHDTRYAAKSHAHDEVYVKKSDREVNIGVVANLSVPRANDRIWNVFGTIYSCVFSCRQLPNRTDSPFVDITVMGERSGYWFTMGYLTYGSSFRAYFPKGVNRVKFLSSARSAVNVNVEVSNTINIPNYRPSLWGN